VLETSTRLLELLSLFQAQRYWSVAGLCERLEVTPRTLRRDVDRLRRLGYPVNSTSGAGGGYQLCAGATLPPLLLDDDEAVAVAVGATNGGERDGDRNRRSLAAYAGEAAADSAPTAQPASERAAFVYSPNGE
jgi:predicted DNA-binding transcriptional regulator YafY